MSHREWSRVKDAFYGALSLAPEARGAYLSETCGEHGPLRSQVLELLAEDRREQPLLDGAIAAGLSEVLAEETKTELAGRLLGAYRVIRPIGQGGESTVYLGRRDDGQFQQDVAIKVLDASRDPELPRGSLERQILARLNHPSIARLFDAGTTQEGLPYFVMELVEGLPIDTYCDRRRLSLQGRLELFEEVCAAVQYAHQSLVVHSDLKPGNILVTAGGAPKLLDFGIARLLDCAVVPHKVPVERAAMTPVYASPEQLRGESLSAASDVYSLGVVLYQLLAGRRPELEGAPLPPSQAAEGRRGNVPVVPVAAPSSPGSRVWARRLRGDLDAIILKALAQEPSRRYPSVAELVADLGRYRNHLPVVARQSSMSYRSRKWLRRRWWAAASLSLALAAMAALAFQEQRLEGALAQARQESAHAAAVTEFLDRLLEASELNANPGTELTVRQVLDQASRALPLDLAHQPRVQGRLLETLGHAYQTLGHLDRAEEALEAALRIHREIAGERHELTAASMDRLAALRLQQGHLEEAERLQRHSLEIRRELYDEGHLAVAEGIHNLGEVLHARGQLEPALNLYLEAAEKRRREVGDEHPAYLESLFELALLFRDRGDQASAGSYFLEALPLARKLHGDHHTLTLQLTHDLAYLLRDSEQKPFAESLYRQAIDGYRATLGPDHRWTSTATRNLARLLRNQGRFDEAEAILLQLRGSRRLAVPAGDLYTAYVEEDLGRLYLAADTPSKAKPHLRRALALQRRHLPPEDWRIAQIQSVLGGCLTRLGQYQEAESLLTVGLHVLEDQLGAAHGRTTKARERLEALRAALQGS